MLREEDLLVRASRANRAPGVAGSAVAQARTCPPVLTSHSYGVLASNSGASTHFDSITAISRRTVAIRLQLRRQLPSCSFRMALDSKTVMRALHAPVFHVEHAFSGICDCAAAGRERQ